MDEEMTGKYEEAFSHYYRCLEALCRQAKINLGHRNEAECKDIFDRIEELHKSFYLGK